MKRYTTILLALIIMSAPLMARAAAPQGNDKQYNDIRTAIRQKNYVDALRLADQVLQDKNLSVNDKVRFLSIAAEASINQGPQQYPVAKSYYEKIIENSTIDNDSKVQAISDLADAYIKSLAGQYLDKMDISPAHAILQRALQLPDLQPEERAAALINVGKLYDREDNDKQALTTYQKILRLKVNDDSKAKAWQAMVDVYVKEVLYGNEQESRRAAVEAISITQKQGYDLVPLYNRMGDFDAVKTLLLKILDNPKSTDVERWKAFSQLPAIARSSGPGRVNGRNNPVEFRAMLVDIQQLSSRYLPALMKEDPSRAKVLLQSFKEAPVSPNVFYYPTNASPAYLAWAGGLILEAPKLSDADYKLVRTKYINALVATGQNTRALTEVAAAQTDARLDAATQFWARLVNTGLTSSTTDLTKITGTETTLSTKDKAQALLDAAQTVLLAGQEETAKALYGIYQEIIPPLPTASINCAFMANAPNDVGSWLTSPLLLDKQSSAKFNRPYGDNLELLQETDANTGGRMGTDSNKKNTGDQNTDFYLACDAQGIHLFFDAHDEHAQEVVDGLLSGSSFETYLAPGENQPYYFFYPKLPDSPATTSPTDFITMYPNANWRLPSSGDGTFRNEIRRTKDGFGISMFLSWELFYDKLPVDNTKWRFESIRWTRSGGYSFAGSQSVHNPSSWGNIIFSGMSKENLNSIKRTIIFQAVAKYRDSLKIQAPVGRWNDPELGDPAFYQSEVAPLLARLDNYAANVNKDMTSADVETIFDKAVPGWMEINYRVAALRTQYLKKKLLKG